MHEEVFRGDIASAKEYFVVSKIRGEFVVVII
jgi:16S rRNA C1402 (ribose-2'-O) methylase RsmI